MSRRLVRIEAMAKHEKRPLSPLESAVMGVIWKRGTATADEVRTALAADRPMKDSTVRTILRRLEEKGYATHTTEGRTFVYLPRTKARSVASEAVRGIVERFCEGSIESLLVGMVDDELVSPQKLRQLADRIS